MGYFLGSESAIRKQPLCFLAKDLGLSIGSSEPSTRFFYDFPSGFCQSFTYLGSGGNENNFETFEDCVQFCGQFEGWKSSYWSIILWSLAVFASDENATCRK